MSVRGLLPILTKRPEMERLRDRLSRTAKAGEEATPLTFGLRGVADAAKPYLAAALAAATSRPVLVVTTDEKRAQAFAGAMAAILGDRPDTDAPQAMPLLDREAMPLERLFTNAETLRARMSALLAIIEARTKKRDESTGEPEKTLSALVIATSIRALTQPVMPPEEFARATVALQAGGQVDYATLLARLAELGYESVAEVEEPGQISHRGGIIDLFAPTRPRPVRIEFFGDTIESLRSFDIESQRSLNPIETLLIPPAREALPARGPDAARELGQIDIHSVHPDAAERWARDLDALRQQASFEDIALYLPYLHRTASVLDYLPADGIILLDGPDHLATLALGQGDEANAVRDRLVREGDIPDGMRSAFIAWEHIEANLAKRRGAHFASLTADLPGAEGSQWGDAAGADLQPANSFGGRLRAFAQEARKGVSERQRIIVVTNQARRIAELFADDQALGNNTIRVAPVPTLNDTPDTGSLTIVHNAALTEGWHSRALALTVFTDTEIFGWSKRRQEQRKGYNTPATFLAELSIGDYVVHIDHGIGRFEGLAKLATDGVEREYLLLAYAGTDRIYLPTDQLNLITRYIGMGEAAPALNKIGGVEWARSKERARSSARDVAKDLLRLYSIRDATPGHAFPPDSAQPWLQELEDAFPYEETPDQARAIAEVKEDMERDRPMDRLVCGDVGYGKTEVALRAAFKAVLDQKQVAVLVPTTVLALQHYNTFFERLKGYPVRVELLSRFRSPKEQKAVLEDLATGKVDILIGTHRLLSADVVFSDLGMMIIDEEQRFGVMHKERLKQLRTEVDVLTLTATPIPRTLHMALVNVRDMSVIETPPQERLPIRTYIRENEDALIREAVLRELDRGGQVFFVHNRVKGIQQLAQHIEELVPEARVAVAHGQMNEDRLEHTMLDFANGTYNVLVSTTIIENGLDIQNANTIIVNNAGFFGLSQLYQLRGRVGRGAHQAYAYFLYHQGTKLTPIAEKRLRAIFEATELGAGFRIAMKDLEIRGAGNLLGEEQSGFMSTVGFELYSQLLAEEVADMQGSGEINFAKPEPPVTVDVPLTGFIPDEYIPDRTLKIHFYQRLAATKTMEQVEALAAEMLDRFGPAPDAVSNLLDILRLKSEAKALGFDSVAFKNDEWIIKARAPMVPNRIALYKRFKGQAHVEFGTVSLAKRLLPADPHAALTELRVLLPLISTKEREAVGSEA
ncbi:MAG: transcription-repair coupling factor [Ktedonobacterales bacterium]|nr:transcription-repair coupling factor [Ktedonobacterales bacterium]